MTTETTTIQAFEQQAATLRPEVEAQLYRLSRFAAGCPPRLQQAVDHSLLAPGKRLRPLLVLWAARACGCSYQPAMPAAVAIEMVHTYSLIHDDLPAMDDDELRRGRPTCHKAFDEATAILAGDALLTRAFEIMATQAPTPPIAAAWIAELAQAAGATGMIGGQVDDLTAEQSQQPPESQEATAELLESIHRRKTAALLIAALRLGGLTANAPDEQMQALAAYGSNLGLAFQIVDDLLDETGQAAQIGKQPGQDAQRGKLTFPAIWGIEPSRRRAAQLIDDAIDNLATFGQHAAALRALAQFVLVRNQ